MAFITDINSEKVYAGINSIPRILIPAAPAPWAWGQETGFDNPQFPAPPAHHFQVSATDWAISLG